MPIIQGYGAQIHYVPLTEQNWPDFEKLFGPKGACGGCWCMWWRLKQSEFDRQKGEGNRLAMKEIVFSGEIPGILLYQKKIPFAWCSISPRERFPRLNRSRVLNPVDNALVWSVVCLFVEKSWRRQGMTSLLLDAAVGFAGNHGASIVEGYPVDKKTNNYPDIFAATGFFSSFEKLGFKECARRSPTRPIMRFRI
jgi:GNAT superfamily N-acetyltransferase